MLCYIGIGSNMGDRRGYIRRATKMLRQTPGFRSMRVSPVYETKPVGGPSRQKDYLNAAAEVRTTLSSRQLLRRLKEIEKRLGRKASRVRWQARPIDLDILFFGKEIIRKRGLVVPHPLIAQRFFV